MSDIARYHDLHPLYQLHQSQWRTLRAAYVGGREWHSQGTTFRFGNSVIAAATGKTGLTWSGAEHQYLFRHPREKDERYEIRKRSSTYENVIRPLVTTVAATVSKACKRCELPMGMDYLMSDVDRAQMDMATFRLQRNAWSHVFPHIFVLLGKPEGAAQPSRMHELAAGVRTYAQIVTPLDLIDWQWNAQDRMFDWALIVERLPQERMPPDMGKGEPTTEVCYTRLEKPGEWIRYANGEEYDRGRTGYDFVPMTIQYGLGQDPESAEPIGIDLLSDAVDKAIEAFNKESWLCDMLQNQCFNQAFFKPLEGAIQEELEISVGSSTYVPAESFAWAAPDTAPMEQMRASIGEDKATIRQMLGVETKGETSQASKSGIALQLEQTSASSMFAGYAAAAEAGERNIWRMAAVMEGENPDDVLVEYARDFSALETAARFDQLMAAVGTFAGKAAAELKKQIFIAVHPDAEADVLAEVYDAIDAEVEAADAQRKAAIAAAERIAAGVPEPGAEPEDEDGDDMRPGKANGRPMPMRAE